MKRRSRKQRQQQQSNLYITIFGVATILIIAFLLIQNAASPGETPNNPPPEDGNQAISATRKPGCVAVSQPAGSGATEESLFPSVSEDDWAQGPETAGVTIIVYSDFQCEGCAGVAVILAQLRENFPDGLRVVFRHYPLLSVNDKAALAVQAAEAAGRQSKFWEMHNLLFALDWASLSVSDFKAWLPAAAAEIGLDVEQFNLDFDSDEIAAIADEAWTRGVELSIPQTPFILINGEYYDGPRDYNSMESILQLKLLEDGQFDNCPPMTIDPLTQYIITLHTEKGDIVIELYPEQAPLAVNNFIFLAREGWYDGVTFHRVLSGFMAQAGDPSATGLGGPGYIFDVETSNLKFDRVGVVGMANAGPGTNGSQFFIIFGPQPHLTGSFTIFGQVIGGMEVVESLTLRNPAESAGLPPGDAILSITIEER